VSALEVTDLAKAPEWPPGLVLRKATPDDVSILVKHRRWMFEDMAFARGMSHAPTELDAMDAAYAQQLQAQLPDDRLQAWVVEAEGRVVASGAILFADWLPRPGDLTECLAYVHSVYTEPDYRRRGLARRVVQTLIEVCRAKGLQRVTLHASDAGRPMYEAMGFVATNEMRLMLD
jgi:GNAT superfamily N-acetyltransferase